MKYKAEDMKEVKIETPEGYIIDEENSTFECIKFKKKNDEVIISKLEVCCSDTQTFSGIRVTTDKFDFCIIDIYEVHANWDTAEKHCKTIHSKAEIPNREQWDIIYKNKEAINKYLENKIEDGHYWTSEEKDSSYCWYVNMYYGISYINYRNYAFRVRPIINFK